MSKHTEYTRFLCCWNKVAKACSSPACARFTRLIWESSRPLTLVVGMTVASVAEIAQVPTLGLLFLSGTGKFARGNLTSMDRVEKEQTTFYRVTYVNDCRIRCKPLG